jgi:mono/diheme cytochrome c family protein
VTNPKSHDPSTVMPAFTNLGKEQLYNLVSYLISLATGSAPSGVTAGEAAESKKTASPSPAAGAPELPTEEKALEGPPGKAAYIIGSSENGADLYKEQCSSCHGPDGKGGVPNPGSDDGTVPPLNPIDRALYNADPKVFAATIDKMIQHGAMPSGPHPALHMPAWGDTRSLTQQEISNLEAYIMKLNGVDRGEIINPGIRPKTFFFIVAGLYLLVILVQGGIRIKRKIP